MLFTFFTTAALLGSLAGGASECAEGQCGLYCDEPCTCEVGVLDCEYADEFDSSDDYPGKECAAYEGEYTNPTKMHWAMAVSSLAAPAMAFGIGANDIANSWATSVGSGAISLRNAVLVGAVFEFAGAVTLGFGVAKTIQKGVSEVTDKDCWACGYCDSKAGLMVGGTAGALAGASTFLMLATKYSLPVSTTHSIVGGVVGMTIVGTSAECLNWAMKGGLGGIIASWFISPILSGLIACMCYLLSKKFVMESATPRRTTMRLIPVLFGMSTSFVVLMMMFKSKALKKRVSPDAPYTWKLVISLIGGVVVTIGSHFLVVPWIRKQLPDLESSTANLIELGKPSDPKAADVMKLDTVEVTPGPDAEAGAGKGGDDTPTKEHDSESSTDSEEKPSGPITRQQSRLIDAQEAFKFALVFIATLECFAHGSNDTANATGPFTSVYNQYKEGLYDCTQPETPVWIMALGGGFLSLGVVFYGQNVIKTIGSDIASVDFHKAFWIELAATVAVITATVLNFPVSTTHCKIGAVVAVGMVSPKVKGRENNVDWKLFTKIAFTWVVTIPVAGSISAIFVAIVEAAMK